MPDTSASTPSEVLADQIAIRLQTRMEQMAKNLAPPAIQGSASPTLSTLFSGLVSQSPLLGIGLLLAQQLLASGGLVGTMAGSTATTTGQNVGSTGVAVIAAGVLNWIKQALTRKPGATS